MFKFADRLDDMGTEQTGAKLMRIYKGKSRISGNVRAIATGLNRKSANKKTGPMVQLWFLPIGNIMKSVWQTGTDHNVCGNCPFRAFNANGQRQARRCYVNVGKAPTNVAKKDDNGSYPEFELSCVTEWSYGPQVF